LTYRKIGAAPIFNCARIGPDLKNHRPIEWIFQGVGLLFTIAVSIYITRLASRALHGRLKET
jgi:hypothetical protein